MLSYWGLQVISYRPSYMSEVSCIGLRPSNDSIFAKLQVQGQLHWPDAFK